jgi:hypothetical protein
MGNIFAWVEANAVELQNAAKYRRYDLTIDDPNTDAWPDYTNSQITLPSEDGTSGSIYFSLDGYTLKAGDIVTLKSGHDTRKLVVLPKNNVSFSIIQDQVKGFIQPDHYVGVGDWPWRNVQADASGAWSADLAAQGPDGQVPIDIVPGMGFSLFPYDDDADFTYYQYTVPYTTHGSLIASGTLIAPSSATSANLANTGKGTIKGKGGTLKFSQ